MVPPSSGPRSSGKVSPGTASGSRRATNRRDGDDRLTATYRADSDRSRAHPGGRSAGAPAVRSWMEQPRPPAPLIRQRSVLGSLRRGEARAGWAWIRPCRCSATVLAGLDPRYMPWRRVSRTRAGTARLTCRSARPATTSTPRRRPSGRPEAGDSPHPRQLRHLVRGPRRRPAYLFEFIEVFSSRAPRGRTRAPHPAEACCRFRERP